MARGASTSRPHGNEKARSRIHALTGGHSTGLCASHGENAPGLGAVCSADAHKAEFGPWINNDGWNLWNVFRSGVV